MGVVLELLVRRVGLVQLVHHHALHHALGLEVHAIAPRREVARGLRHKVLDEYAQRLAFARGVSAAQLLEDFRLFEVLVHGTISGAGVRGVRLDNDTEATDGRAP